MPGGLALRVLDQQPAGAAVAEHGGVRRGGREASAMSSSSSVISRVGISETR